MSILIFPLIMVFYFNLIINCINSVLAKITLKISSILLVFGIFVVLFFYISQNPVYCAEPLEAFFERQHNLRVALIIDTIQKADTKELLLTINKCIKSKLALLTPELVINNEVDNITPLIVDPVTKGDVLRRLLFWFFCIFMSLMLDATIIGGSYLLSNTVQLQVDVLSNFQFLSTDYTLVKDLYDILISLEVIQD